MALEMRCRLVERIFCVCFTALVHPENQLCAFLNYSGVDAWRIIEIQGTYTINVTLWTRN